MIMTFSMSRNRFHTLLVLVMMAFAPASDVDAVEVNWSDVSLSALHGNHYQLSDNELTIFTIEWGADYSFGDHFFFIDNKYDEEHDYSAYAELLVRGSVNKNTSWNIQKGWLTDVLVAVRVEHAHPLGEDNQAYGIGTDWRVPGFRYFKVNAFTRRNDMVDDNSLLNLVWGLPFSFGSQSFLYDGFFDWVSGVSGQYATSFNLTSQLKWQVTEVRSQPLYVGVEYVYWNNKYGVRDVNERNLNALIKLHF